MTDITQQPKIFGVSEADRKAIELLYRSFSESADLLDEAVTEDWQDIPLAPGQEPGRDGMKPLINAFRDAFSDLQIIIHEMIGAPGRVAVRAEITGIHRGEWFGVAATGTSFCMPIHEFHYVENGRVTHTWHLEDWLGWFFQVGAFPVGEKDAAQ